MVGGRLRVATEVLGYGIPWSVTAPGRSADKVSVWVSSNLYLAKVGYDTFPISLFS